MVVPGRVIGYLWPPAWNPLDAPEVVIEYPGGNLDEAKARIAIRAGIADPQWVLYPPGLDMPTRRQDVVLNLEGGTRYQVHWQWTPDLEAARGGPRERS
jgi:hypothetical protein